jgi:hypothetical protein
MSKNQESDSEAYRQELRKELLRREAEREREELTERTLQHFHRKLFGIPWNALGRSRIIDYLIVERSVPARDLSSKSLDELAAMLRGSPDEKHPGTGDGWLTVTEAAKAADTGTGTVSRAVDDGKLTSNGKKGHQRRIDPASFVRWKLERDQRPESSESEEQVRKQVKKHCRR